MDKHVCDLVSKQCKPCEGSCTTLNQEQVKQFLVELPGWEQRDTTIFKKFEFKNYYQTISFVNAVAWIAHKQDHHPDMEISYRICHIRYTTHAIGGLSENDFISASKVEALLKV